MTPLYPLAARRASTIAVITSFISARKYRQARCLHR